MGFPHNKGRQKLEGEAMSLGAGSGEFWIPRKQEAMKHPVNLEYYQ
jgi:predicted patatin/cPLA2 family phospholipase